MITYEDIKKTESEIRTLTNQLSSVQPKNYTKLKTQIAALEYQQAIRMKSFLESTHNNYQKLVKENFDLLTNDQIDFMIVSGEEKVFKSHATRYDGQLDEEGLLSLTATNNDRIIFTFMRGSYPLRYKGWINYFGKANVQIEKRGYRLFGIGSRMPSKLMGSIDKKGVIVIETIETYADGGHYNTEKSISQIAADPFAGDSNKKDSFFGNTAKLNKIIEDFRNNFKGTKLYGKQEPEKRAWDQTDDYRKEYGY